ncbi:methylthioribose kinase [Bacillus tianshenii]|nr:methylthioribose kinase [Bacillus tianshenii]
MIQRFIELGEGYSDLYELLEVARNNRHRVKHMMAYYSTKNEQQVASLAVVLEPTTPGDFQPIYICREGIPNPHFKPNQRFDLFQQTAEEIGKKVIELDVQPSTTFGEVALYYSHLIGILRMNHYIAPLQ